MSLAPGTRLGPYEILGPLGAGGMGEVYRARDPRLARDVAIKALPVAFANDPDRLARFEREAKLLASLSHPNIGALYGLEEVAGHRYLILELIEGETLAERLAAGPLPLEEALDVCRQIAAALEAAHEGGVVHRDLKPGNVKRTPGGEVKVLDFGLAKGTETSHGSSLDLSQSPTLAYAPTGAGVILGTAAYMSPEQARGKAVDKRTDIWSFGCVLYECLTGRQAFAGETVSDLVAKILERDPDWSALPARTPARIRELLRRCLSKDAKQRLRDIGDARIEMAAGSIATSDEAPATRSRLGWAPALAVALVAVALGVLAGGRLWHVEEPTTRLSVLAPDADAVIGDHGSFAISPDGSALAFVVPDSAGTPRLWLRPLDAPEARLLAGTDGAQWPFWSPDAREVGFFSGGKLRRVPAAGGTPRVVCDAANPRGGAWGRQGTIVFAPEPRGGLFQVSADGGAPTPVTMLDTLRKEVSHRFPCFLGDGRHFVFATESDTGGPQTMILGASLGDPRPRPLLRCSFAPSYAAPGWLVFMRDQALLAQRIDSRALRMVGRTILLDDLASPNGSISETPATSCSANGVLVYAPTDQRPTEIAWVGRDGRTIRSIARVPAFLIYPSLSGQGDRVAASESASEGNVMWICDVLGGSASRITSASKRFFGPVWNAAGTRLIGTGDNHGENAILVVDPVSGADSLVLSGTAWRVPSSWSPDGGTVVFGELVQGRRYDLRYLTLGNPPVIHGYLETPANEPLAALSHDGRWLAYASDASGELQVYVDRFPTHDRAHRVTSFPTSEFAIPSWRTDDRALYFLGTDNSVYEVDVRTTPDFATGPPRLLFRAPADTRGGCVAPDGKRVLLLRPVGRQAQSLTVVRGWMRGLERRR